MKTDLPRDPKVVMMADYLLNPGGELARHVCQMCQCDMSVTRNVMRNAVTGALVTLWGVTRNRGKRYGNDLRLKNVTVDILDEIADLPGIGGAMCLVGWAVESGKDLVFPNFFEEMNTQASEVAATKNADRQRRYRENKRNARNVTRNVTRNDRVEKSREEKNIQTTNVVCMSPSPFGEVPPTLEAVQSRISERKLDVDAEAFLAHYEARGWVLSNGKRVRNWDSCLTTWQKNAGRFDNQKRRPCTPEEF
jgi:hypothetical protein